jgi:hypothetical protein
LKNQKDYQVIDKEKVSTPEDLYCSIRTSVAQWVEEHGKIDGYVVTDPDIEIENPTRYWLEKMYKCLQAFPEFECVGSALRMDDIPSHYPLKNLVRVMEARNRVHPVKEWQGLQIRSSRIDTTLALYRPDFVKTGICHKAIRMRGDGMARHLDWYLDPKRLTGDQIAYFQASPKISHFGGLWFQHPEMLRVTHQNRRKRRPGKDKGKARKKKTDAIRVSVK